ncbi:MAG: phage portal protein [Ignisphaera sp.]|nr:phage portal protein [Ignisphaera sp.]
MGFFNFFSKQENKTSNSIGSSLFVHTKASRNNAEAAKNFEGGKGSLAKISEENSFHTSELIFSCVDYITKAASQAVPKIGVLGDNGELLPLPKKDKLNAWIQSPNPFFTWGEMIELNIQAILLSGTTFMTLESNKGNLESWFLGSPSSVKIVPDSSNYIKGVIWKDKITYNADEVCIVRNPTLNNMYYGVPAIRPLLDTLLLESYALEDLKSFYENSSLLTGLLESEYALSPEQVSALQDQFAVMYGQGGVNRGGTAVLPGGITYKPIQVSPNDSKLIDSLQISDKRVLRVFKINALALGGESTSTSKPQDLMKAVFNTAVRPYLYKLEDSITLFLRGKYKNPKLTFTFDLDRVVELETSLDVRADAAKTLYSTGLATLNEGRNMIGLPKVAVDNADKNILAAYLFGTGATYVQDGAALSGVGTAPSTGGAGSTNPTGGASNGAVAPTAP